ncbi:LOW QUALITY PROTEIN: cilia- and flagella-associated protein 74 [Bombina bombina]|uniref:LOW QUALITY PROTEIN: cilia- and flagella-associated protein 74 n=1 Tax=Bombina bombina TaxID=8345 RepID=UPI00235AE2ED|nr:LOW QUALITY PROTEIN: cilia- and flagella-associated protein 74 [Bombina bombina]
MEDITNLDSSYKEMNLSLLEDSLITEDKCMKVDNEPDDEYSGDELEHANGSDVLSDTDSEFSWASEANCLDLEQSSKGTNNLNKVQIFRMRHKLNQLDGIQKEKELLILKIREELNACRQRIEDLEQQKSNIEKEILAAQEANNTAAVFRFQAVHRRLSTELVNEEDVESKIATMLKENEYDLWQIEVEQGKFDDVRERLQKDEDELNRETQGMAEWRMHKEKMSLTLAQRTNWKQKKSEINRLQEQELRYRKAVEDAQKNQAIAALHLKETLSRVREKEAEKEMKTREEMEKRMQAVLNLKHSITSNRENLSVIEARNKAKMETAKKKEMLEKEAIVAQGGDVTKFMIHQKRLQEFERKKQDLEERQKIRKQEIISRILQEEANQEKQTKRSSSLDIHKSREPSKLRNKTIQYIESNVFSEAEHEVINKWRSPSPLSSDEDDTTTTEQSSELISNQSHEDEEENEILSQPEFMGLWNKDYKPYKVPEEETECKPLRGSKMEKEIMAETLRKLRSGIVEKQVVSGHEFKGCPFYSKPSLIHFKDFDVGKTYKKKMILTNASYTINFCKLMGVSDHLKDFITIHFYPPGQMSAGMSCDLTVIFKPMLNEDLEGEVMFLAQTGSFSIPLKCSTKKCELTVDKENIDFGTHVIGETVLQTITLTNRGALGTKFYIRELSQANLNQNPEEKTSLEEATSPALNVHITKEKDSDTSVESRAEEQGETGASRQSERASEDADLAGDKTDAKSAAGKEDSDIELVTEDAVTLVEDTIEDGDLQDHIEEDYIEIKLGEITEGEIGPLKTVKIPVIFTPTFPGKAHILFEITFDNSSCKAICITVTGTAIDVPVYIPNSNIDLKICTYDRLYQDSVIVKNRAKTALRLKFEVCKELKNHMELLPKTGFIQAQSSFSVQLKFLPRISLSQDAGPYFDNITGVLEVPMMVSVADQARPVPFTVHAVITTSDLEINPVDVDFGYCTIFEAVLTPIQLTNKSILPQEFGFVGIPEYVDIQPNDGFGTLLPLETVKIDIIFRAEKAKEYHFELTCKSAINRIFKVACKAIGVHPPLELSHSLVQFPATALNDASTATLHVKNSHTSRNEFTHAVPRIGKSDIAPVGPTSFEFHMPEDCPITISPSVGTVLPGERGLIQVSFRPTLSDKEIREEALRILCRAAENKVALEKEAASKKESEIQSKKEKNDVPAKKEKRKQVVSPKQSQKEKDANLMEPVTIELPKLEEIKLDSDEYSAARIAIYRRFIGKFKKFIIPCFIASCDISRQKDHDNLNFSPHNTLYLELHCPAVAPPVIVISENGRQLICFGEVATGQRVVKRVTLQNISPEPLHLGFSILNPCGPFMLLNPVDVVQPGDTCFLLIAFSPDENNAFFENLEVRVCNQTLTLGLRGQGLTPSLSCSLEGGVIDMGYVLVNDITTTTFKLQNMATVPVTYSLKLESLSVTRHNDLQKLPSFICSKEKSLVGPQNYNGFSVFSVSPVEGTIDPEKSHEFTVTFSPDHESSYYCDTLKVELFGKHTAHVIQLKGACRNHMMYVEGGEPLDVPVESTNEGDEPVKSLLLTLQCNETETDPKPAVRELHIGCIRSTLLPARKNIEFSWENVQLLLQKGFTIEPVKAVVDLGQRKTVLVSWVPPAGYDPRNPVTTSCRLIVKGDITEQYQVFFTTQVVSAQDDSTTN